MNSGSLRAAPRLWQHPVRNQPCGILASFPFCLPLVSAALRPLPCKTGRGFFGDKAHIGVDQEWRLTRHVVLISAKTD